MNPTRQLRDFIVQCLPLDGKVILGGSSVLYPELASDIDIFVLDGGGSSVPRIFHQMAKKGVLHDGDAYGMSSPNITSTTTFEMQGVKVQLVYTTFTNWASMLHSFDYPPHRYLLGGCMVEPRIISVAGSYPWNQSVKEAPPDASNYTKHRWQKFYERYSVAPNHLITAGADAAQHAQQVI